VKDECKKFPRKRTKADIPKFCQFNVLNKYETGFVA
jgi:hypothetical protein